MPEANKENVGKPDEKETICLHRQPDINCLVEDGGKKSLKHVPGKFKSSIIPTRYVVGGMCFLGIVLQYLMKVNLSVAIIAMAAYQPENSTNVKDQVQLFSTVQGANDLDVCPGGESPTENKTTEIKEFNWDEMLQGHVLSAYYYGYVSTQLLGGRLSEMFGSKVILGPAVFVSGILTLLSPAAARLHVGVFIAVRAFIGAASGMIIPSGQTAFSKWFPPEERLPLGSIMMSAIPIGTIIALSLSGVLAKAGGWPLVFYVFGGISVAWYFAWLFLMYSTPEQHPRISTQERNYILSQLGNQKEAKAPSPPVPWLDILTSGPFWAHILIQTGFGWVGYSLLSELPTYLNNILHFDLQKSGVISALPYVFKGVCMIGAGYLSQWLIKKKYLTKLHAYRIFNTIAAGVAAGSLITITFIGCDAYAIVVLLASTFIAGGAYGGGTLMNHLDLANNFAGTLAGISLTVVNAMGIFTPLVTGAIINKQQTRSRWAIVFYISSGVCLSTYVICMLLMSADEQPWNRPEATKSKASKRNEKKEQLTAV